MTEIDYDNFKNAVSIRNPERASLYHSVWHTLYSIQSKQEGWLGYGDNAYAYGDEWDDEVSDKRQPPEDTEEAIIKDFLDGCGDPR